MCFIDHITIYLNNKDYNNHFGSFMDLVCSCCILFPSLHNHNHNRSPHSLHSCQYLHNLPNLLIHILYLIHHNHILQSMDQIAINFEFWLLAFNSKKRLYFIRIKIVHRSNLSEFSFINFYSIFIRLLITFNITLIHYLREKIIFLSHFI